MTTEGERLKEIRQKLGLTQKEFGKIFDVSKQYVSNMEKSTKPVNREIIVSLLVDHNISANYILAGIEPMFLSNTPQTKDLDEVVESKIKDLLKKYGLLNDL